MKRLALVALGLLSSAPLAAQFPGDSVRVRSDVITTTGRFVEYAGAEIVLAHPDGSRSTAALDGATVERYERNSAAVTVILTGLAGPAGYWISQGIEESDPWTDSRVTDTAILAGLGLAVGALWHMANPGDWKRVDR